jgi:hypothetical protein
MELFEFQVTLISCEKIVELRKHTEEMEYKCLEGSAPKTHVKSWRLSNKRLEHFASNIFYSETICSGTVNNSLIYIYL